MNPELITSYDRMIRARYMYCKGFTKSYEIIIPRSRTKKICPAGLKNTQVCYKINYLAAVHLGKWTNCKAAGNIDQAKCLVA
jgi:hypothetical protein